MFLTPEQVATLAKIAVLPSRLANPEIVGKSAQFIADKAGFSVPQGTRALVVELDGVGRDYPLSIEKLSPILAFYVVRDWKQGCERAKEILRYGGMGHTLSIHSKNDDIIREFALQKPASRIVANSPATHGAVGFSTGLAPAMTLGCGSYGGNITSDNITPLHLINVKRLAYEVRGVDVASALDAYGYTGERTAPLPSAVASTSVVTTSPPSSSGLPPLEQRVAQFLGRRGLGLSSSGSRSGSASAPDASFEGETSSGHTVGAVAPVAPVAPVSSVSGPSVNALEFVSEDDVRTALSDGRKLPVGASTLITPSARELGNENNIFVRV